MQKTRRWFKTGEWPSGGESLEFRGLGPLVHFWAMGSKFYICSCSKAILEGGWGTLGSLMLFILCSVHFSPACALTGTSQLPSILSLVMPVPQMFAQQLCTCVPVGRGRQACARAFLWGLKMWVDALLWPFLRAGLLYSHWCPSAQAQMRRIFLKIFSHGKSLYENSYYSCFFLCKCGCIFHSWEMIVRIVPGAPNSGRSHRDWAGTSTIWT